MYCQNRLELFLSLGRDFIKMKDAGFKQDALYLIRPDGHVGLATEKQWVRVLKMYLEACGIVAFGAE